MSADKEKQEREAAGRRARRLLDIALGHLEAAQVAAVKAGLIRQGTTLARLNRDGAKLLRSWPGNGR